MKSLVLTESLVLDNKEIHLVSVTGSTGGLGICDTTRDKRQGKRETFFVGSEAILNILQKSYKDDYSNKIIWQVSSTEKCGDFQSKIQLMCDDYFIKSKPMLASVMPLLNILKNGVYAVYENDLIQTDGSSNFFWNSYLVGHEFVGSGTYSSTCGKQHNLPPCFLIPTDNLQAYSEVMIRNEDKRYAAGGETGGIAFHISGLFCALLSNHNAATSALIRGQKLKCIVIEPIRNIMFKEEFEQPGETTAGNSKMPYYEVDCLYTHPLKIPVTNVSSPILENFFTTRYTDIPQSFNTIRQSSERTTKLKNKRAIPRPILDKCESMPDAEMIQSAAIIDELSDLELQALLEGKTELNEKIIISKNYYSSVVNALNYLQYKNYNSFISFATAILKNEDLTAVHLYVANRLQSVMNEEIFATFNEIFLSESPVYAPLASLAEKYKKHYTAHLDRMKKERESDSLEEENANAAVPVFRRNTEQEINALDMAKKLNFKK